MGTSFALCDRAPARTSAKDEDEAEDDKVNNMQSQKHDHSPVEYPVFLSLQPFASPQKDNDQKTQNYDDEAAPVVLSIQPLPRPDHDEPPVVLSIQPQPLPQPDSDTDTSSPNTSTTDTSTADSHTHVAIDMTKNPLGTPYGSTPPQLPHLHPSGWTPINAALTKSMPENEEAAQEEAATQRKRKRGWEDVDVSMYAAIENIEVEVELEDGWVLLPRLGLLDKWYACRSPYGLTAKVMYCLP